MTTLFDTVHLLAYVVAFLLIATFVLAFFISVIYYREKDTSRHALTQNAQLAAVMRSCNIRIWTVRPKKQREAHYILLSETGTVAGYYSPLDFSNLYKHEDFDKMRQLIRTILKGEREEASCRMRSCKQADGERRTYDVNIRILDRDFRGMPTAVVGLQRDITDDLRSERELSRLLTFYQTIFDSSIIDMMYYDKDGILRDINNKACETFGIKDRNALLAKGYNLKDIPAYKGLDIHNKDGYRMSSITDIGKVRRDGKGVVKEITNNGLIYYDTIACPILRANGEVSGVYTAGRSVNELVESYHRQKESTKQLQEATKHIQDYINNINHALQVSQVRLMNYKPDTHELEIRSDLKLPQYELTQLRCIEMVSPEHRPRVASAMRKMDRRSNTRIDLTVRTVLHDDKGRDIWFSFSVIPMLKADGTVSHYFGMCRNETEMKETEQLLMAETKKAKEAELVKESFLQNMSYEIRTPLNAVLGFAELFNAPHNPEDEQVFVEYIKENSNQLLELVNDILFISRLDAHMIEIKRQPIDFAQFFEGCCRMGWSQLAPEVKCHIENPYAHLIVDVDETNLQSVIQKLCQHAAVHTHSGYVKAKYEYRHGMLTISIEDTGEGISKELLPTAFDRFAKNEQGVYTGTGLVLPIIKELTEQMGGFIDLQSEKGKGSTMWISIPCTATEIVKKEI